MQFWMPLWTAVWFVGLVLFTGLAISITINGARDLVFLLRSLSVQHDLSDGGAPADKK